MRRPWQPQPGRGVAVGGVAQHVAVGGCARGTCTRRTSAAPCITHIPNTQLRSVAPASKSNLFLNACAQHTHTPGAHRTGLPRPCTHAPLPSVACRDGKTWFPMVVAPGLRTARACCNRGGPQCGRVTHAPIHTHTSTHRLFLCTHTHHATPTPTPTPASTPHHTTYPSGQAALMINGWCGVIDWWWVT